MKEIQNCPHCGRDSGEDCGDIQCPYTPSIQENLPDPAFDINSESDTAEQEGIDFDLLTEPIQEISEDLFVPLPKNARVIKLPNGKTIIPNEQQNSALDLLEVFINDRTKLIYVLSGFAGTGKTTIVKEGIKYFANRPGNYAGLGSVCVSAPTHKAKKVIADATNLEGQTIQSLLGLAPNTELADFDINKPEFSPKKKPTLEYYRLLVIDEGSMLNKDLWEMIKSQAARSNVKLILMGDQAQLPPVKEDISPIFVDDQVTYRYELTKVERQAGDNPLMLLYDAIRNDIHTVHDQYHKATSIIETEGQKMGYIFHSELMNFGREVVNAFRSEKFKQDKNHCKVLTWTNVRVQFWNHSIRKTLLSDLAKTNISEEQLLHCQVLMPNELLMGYNTYSDGIQNAGEYQIISMQYDEKKVYYGVKKEYFMMLQGYRVCMLDIDQGTQLNTFILDPDPEEERKFVTVFNSYLFLAKTKKAWPAYYTFKGEVLLLRAINDNRGQLICKKDLDYAYALSVHKSQGSTYDQVFVDEADINKNRNHTERNKLKYVAFSRPRYLATILTGG